MGKAKTVAEAKHLYLNKTVHVVKKAKQGTPWLDQIMQVTEVTAPDRTQVLYVLKGNVTSCTLGSPTTEVLVLGNTDIEILS